MIDYLIDLVSWAVTAMPFMIGLKGGGGGSPQPPQLNAQQSAQLYESQLRLMQQYMPGLTQEAGRQERGQTAENTLFGLEMLTNPTGRMFVDRVAEHTRLRSDAQREHGLLTEAANRAPQNWQRITVNINGQNRTFTRDQYDARRQELDQVWADQSNYINHYANRDVVGELRGALPEQFAQRDRLLADTEAARGSTAEYARAQDAMLRGVLPGTADLTQAQAVRPVSAGREGAAQAAGVSDIRADRAQAAQMGNFGSANAARAQRVSGVQAGQVGSGAIGQALMNRALQGVQRGGALSAQEGRDATQSARQAFAARGMATGNSAIGAELLNRDRFRRQREMEDLGFAQNVQQQDVARQFQNVGNRLNADMANMEMSGRMSLSDQQAQMQANLANLDARLAAARQAGDWQQAAALANQQANLQAATQSAANRLNTQQFNVTQQNQMTDQFLGRQLQASMANQQSDQQRNLANMQSANQMAQFNATQYADAQRTNIGLLGQASAMADAERGRQLALGQDAYNFGLATDPRMMLAGLGSPYANMTAPAMSMVSGTPGLNPMYSGGQFSGGGSAMGGAIGGGVGMLAGAGLGAALAGPTLGLSVPVGMALGAGLGGGVGGMFGSALSDKREKTDIKPLGTLSNVLKIPAYEYRYKGEKKKRKGVMAQDVQKVLPEAVAEVDYKGKKRLAIKPDVIGAALAQELAEQSKAVAA